MPFTPASGPSVFAFLLVLLGVVIAFVAGIWRAYPGRPSAQSRIIALTFIYLMLVGVMVTGGGLAALPLSGIPVFFVVVLTVSLGVGLSSVGGRLAAAVPVTALVGFQAFRLPLELILHDWARQGTIPDTMTWTGQNWDVVSGVAAIVAVPFPRRSMTAAWIANVVGGLLLLNVMRVALMSSPVPFGWGVEPPLLLALHLPYAYIGPVCVGGALIAHVVLTRALLRCAPDAALPGS